MFHDLLLSWARDSRIKYVCVWTSGQEAVTKSSGQEAVTISPSGSLGFPTKLDIKLEPSSNDDPDITIYRGRISVDLFRHLVPHPESTIAFASGPSGMVGDALIMLNCIGVPVSKACGQKRLNFITNRHCKR